MAVKRFSNSLISQSGQDKVTNFIAGYSPAIDEMDLIERVVVGAGGTSSITFSNIPQTYQHLQIKLIEQSDRAAAVEAVSIRFNGDTGSNYAVHDLYGTGSIAGAGGSGGYSRADIGYVAGGSAGVSVFGVAVIDILDYASTSKAATLRSLAGYDGNGNGYIGLFSALWTNTNAVTTILLYPQYGTVWKQYTTASLYGVKA